MAKKRKTDAEKQNDAAEIQREIPPAKPTKKRKTSRRGNGEGSIFQRGDGRWVGTISIGFHESGRRRRRTIYGWTKREVQDKLSALQGQKSKGTLQEVCKMTVGEWLDYWLKAVHLTVKPYTYQNYSQFVRLYLKPQLSGIRLASLTSMHIQNMHTILASDGKSAHLRKRCHSILRASLSHAMVGGLLHRNPCIGVKVQDNERKEMMVWTEAQTAQFLKASETDRLHALYVVALTTGLRQGELLGLKWEDIDLQAATLQVRRSIVSLNTLSVGEPKTKTSKRKVGLPQFAVDALWQHKAKMLAEGHASAEWVFCSKAGTPQWKQNLLNYSFYPILERAGVPKIRFHDMRHTAATLLLMQGVPVNVVQQRMGHSKASMTLDVYGHVLPAQQQDVVSKLDRMFGAAGA